MNVLLVTDLSEPGLKSVEGMCACEASGFEKVTLLHVIDLDPYTAGGSVPQIAEWAGSELDRAAAGLRERGFVADARVEIGPAVDTIHSVADDVAADLVVTTNLGKGAVTGRLLGSTAERLAFATHRPVLIERVGHDGERWCRRGGGSPFVRILLGVDLDDGTASLIQKAGTMPGIQQLKVVHVAHDEDDRATAQESLDHAVAAVPAGKAAAATVAIGRTVEALLEQAREWGASAIAVGSCTRGMLQRGLLGSVARGVARHADRAVLLLPPA